ncbi:COG4223 family protein [Mesorhizobium sp. ZMM04-5]|uniref:COG4223 family protein n=1 Tax=Mesorhizobium marinum TaxID=3228790 RepID=A0ABV3QXT1_9HYPH
MVKTPRTRHSNTEREPVTIELGPNEVSRVTGEAEAVGDNGTAEDNAAADGSTSTPSNGEPDTATAESTFPEAPAGLSTDPGDAVKTDKSESDRAQASAAPPPSATRQGRGSALGAGLAGGLVALAAAGALQYAGLLGAPEGSQAPVVPEAVQNEIASLKSDLDSLKATAPAPSGELAAQVEGLSTALEQMKADYATLQKSVASAGDGQTVDLAPLNTKISEIEGRIAAIGSGPEAATPDDIAAINERIAGVEALAKAVTDAGSAADGRIGALEQSLAALGAKVEAQAGQPKIALAIAASALKSAIERGSPFEPEVETFAAIAADAPGLAELRAHAKSGIATRAEIIAETDAAAKAMIAAASPPPGDDGFFERLLSSAESMVTVRPIGDIEGPGVPETVARMEVAVKSGDLARAISEYDTLPERSKAAGAAYADRIKARLAAEQLADQAISAAMQAS